MFDITNSLNLEDNETVRSLQTILLDASGQIIAGPMSMIEKKKKESTLSTLNLIKEDLQSAKQALAGNTGILEEHGLTGKLSLIGYAGTKGFKDFKGLGWATLTIQESDEAYKPIYLMRNHFIKRILGLSVLVVIIAIFSIQKIAKPINELTRATESIINNDYSVALENFSQDEIGTLARSFMAMRHKLKEILKLINASANQLAESTVGILNNIQQQASVTAQQSTSVSQISATLEELATNAIQVSENALKVENLIIFSL